MLCIFCILMFRYAGTLCERRSRSMDFGCISWSIAVLDSLSTRSCPGSFPDPTLKSMRCWTASSPCMICILWRKLDHQTFRSQGRALAGSSSSWPQSGMESLDQGKWAWEGGRWCSGKGPSHWNHLCGPNELGLCAWPCGLISGTAWLCSTSFLRTHWSRYSHQTNG